MTREERRARLVARHRLDRTGVSVERVARDLVGLHSSDPAAVYLSLWARVPGVTPADVSQLLYERRELLRIYGMRRTLWVVPRDVGEDIDAACTRKIAEEQRRRILGYMERGDWDGDAEVWLDEVSGQVVAALEQSDEPLTGRQLGDVVPDMRRKLQMGPGEVGMTTRVLFLLSTDGRITRARPKGTWVSSQYTWSPFERWAGAPFIAKDRAEAVANLIERWLASFGPGTLDDLVWWTGLGKREVVAALGDLEAVEVNLEDGVGYLRDCDAAVEVTADRSVALLPSLDPTTMGWKQRDWYLGRHAPDLFDRNGNAGPTIWVDGRVVGGWAHHPNGSVVFRFLEPVDSWAEARVEAVVGELSEWIGEIRYKPRFPTPLEKALHSG
mgnify:CR=1 FL=1